MPAETSSQLESLLCAAIEISSDTEREAYLDKACGTDSELREKVERLVVAHFQAGGFLKYGDASLGETMSLPTLEQVGSWIGSYKLLEQIGEGGMGVVYLALQEKPIRRKVALKIIKPGMDSRQVIARFEAERQALAIMNHTHIAKVLDAGTTESGSPYFVMELVRGIPITNYCDRHKLDLRLRLELFVKVCHAVQHAHQKGVIHRDLKPSNILVELDDVRAVPKVIDFGVAKATHHQLTENSMHTGLSQMIGTPLYMSPEQAQMNSLDVDTRSDVYSLGVLLYELLTGSTPFDAETLKQAGFDEMRRIIREDDPLRPSFRISTLEASFLSTVAEQRQTIPRNLSSALRGELDWIVLKAMEKDRTRRYESANSLAKDLERYLNDEQVEACPPSTAYRLKKFYTRHKSTVLATSVVLIALMAATGTTVTLAVRENQVAQRRLLVQRGINEVLSEVARLRGQVSTAELGAQTTLARAREQIQRAQALAETGEADSQLVAQVRQLASELDLEQRDGQLLAALNAAWLAEPNLDWDRRFASEKSVSLLRDALTADGMVVGRDDPLVVASQIKRRREIVRSEIVAALYEWHSLLAPPIGVVLKKNQKPGLVAYVAPESPAGRDGNLKKGDVIVGIGQERGESFVSTSGKTVSEIVLLLRGERGTVVRLEVLPDGVKESRTLEIHRDTTASWLWNVIKAADTDPWRSDVRDTCELEDEALRLAQLGKLIDSVDLSAQPVRFLNRVGAELVNAQGVELATNFMKKVWQKHPSDIATNISLAICLRRNEPAQIEEGLRYYTAAVALSPESALLRNMRGIIFHELKKYDEAIIDHREALRLKPYNENLLTNLFIVFEKQGKWDEAFNEYREALKITPFAKAYVAHTSLGNALRRRGKLDEAVNEYREAIRLKPDYAMANNNLAWLFATSPDPKKRDPAQAVELAKKAVELMPISGECLNTLGIAQYRSGRWKTAIEVLEKANKLSDKIFSFSGFFLAMAHWQLDEKLEARTWYDQSVDWMAKNMPNDPDLLRFREEAAELLGVTEELKSIKVD